LKKTVGLLIIIVSLALSCKKGSQTPDILPDVKIRYVDSTGNDLFSRGHDGQNGYWMDSVMIYDYKNGIKTLIHQPATYDYPNGYVFTTYSDIITNLPVQYMVVFANNDVVNRYSNYIIQLKTGLFDTMKVHLTGPANYGSVYDSVWDNSQYEPSGKAGGFITIVK